MYWFHRMFLALAACALTAAAAPNTDYDPTIDFQGWQRFVFELPAPDAESVGPMDNELFHKRLRNLTSDLLSDRGYIVDAAAPQFEVRARLTAQAGAKRKPSMSFGLGGGSFGSSGGVSLGTSTSVGGEKTTAYTLTIEIRDATTNELAWQGWREVSDKVSDAESSALEKSVRDILKPFPPKPKKKKK